MHIDDFCMHLDLERVCSQDAERCHMRYIRCPAKVNGAPLSW